LVKVGYTYNRWSSSNLIHPIKVYNGTYSIAPYAQGEEEIIIQPEVRFTLSDSKDFIRCWTFFYRLHKQLQAQQTEDSDFDVGTALNALRTHAWRSADKKARAGRVSHTGHPSEHTEDVAMDAAGRNVDHMGGEQSDDECNSSNLASGQTTSADIGDQSDVIAQWATRVQELAADSDTNLYPRTTGDAGITTGPEFDEPEVSGAEAGDAAAQQGSDEPKAYDIIFSKKGAFTALMEMALVRENEDGSAEVY
jgi:hypothetical protein